MFSNGGAVSLVVAIDDIKPDQIRNRRIKGNTSNNGGTNTSFLKSSADSPDDPGAFLVQFTPGGSLRAHYHTADQFQVLVNGEGTFGRHQIAPYYVHFARAYTPYGPLLSEGGWGFLTLRARHSLSSQLDFEKLKQMPERRPWQASQKVEFSATGAEPVLHPLPEIQGEQGLYAGALSVPPHAQMVAPAPTGDGQYVVAVKGSLVHEGRELKALTVVFLKPGEPAFRIQAGARGVEALVLNFPGVTSQQALVQRVRSAGGLKKWQCALCAFAYDEAVGMPEDGISAGTCWEDVPDTWNCPDCSASKSDFQMVEV
jgi:rubredoxin